MTSAKLISAAGARQDVAAELAAPADHQCRARQLQQDRLQELARRVGAHGDLAGGELAAGSRGQLDQGAQGVAGLLRQHRRALRPLATACLIDALAYGAATARLVDTRIEALRQSRAKARRPGLSLNASKGRQAERSRKHRPRLLASRRSGCRGKVESAYAPAQGRHEDTPLFALSGDEPGERRGAKLLDFRHDQIVPRLQSTRHGLMREAPRRPGAIFAL